MNQETQDDPSPRTSSALVSSSFSSFILHPSSLRKHDQRSDHLDELPVLELPLADVAVGAGLQAAAAVLLAVLVADDHDGDLLILDVGLERAGQVQAVEARHVDVDQ